jgi:hypothetical protein
MELRQEAHRESVPHSRMCATQDEADSATRTLNQISVLVDVSLSEESIAVL